MKCIYLDEEVCKAQPYNVNSVYKPDAETLKAYCNNDPDMKACPRAIVFHEHLKSIKGK